ncbi:MAG: hypothetical protein NT159_19345 [Proteobacteria bacterium]|nr:hypothetical protein [Pseudomonadota bacterium]
MLLGAIVGILMALTLPVVCCLVILRAREGVVPLVGAISAVAAVWLLSTSLLPPLRAIALALRLPPYWAWGMVTVLSTAQMAMILLVPKWIAAALPRIDGAGTVPGQWFTFVTRFVAGVALAQFALVLEAVFALVVSQLGSSGVIIYLWQPDDVPYLSAETLRQALHAAINVFVESTDAPATHTGLLPGLPLSMVVQTVAMGINIFVAIVVSPDEDNNNEQTESIGKP